MLAAFRAVFLHDPQQFCVSWLLQLQSTALSRRKTTKAAFERLSALPPTKQGFPDRSKAFLTQQPSCFESSHPPAVLVFSQWFVAQRAQGFSREIAQVHRENQTIYPALAMHPWSSCLPQARPFFPAIELFVKVSAVQCVFVYGGAFAVSEVCLIVLSEGKRTNRTGLICVSCWVKRAANLNELTYQL